MIVDLSKYTFTDDVSELIAAAEAHLAISPASDHEIIIGHLRHSLDLMQMDWEAEQRGLNIDVDGNVLTESENPHGGIQGVNDDPGLALPYDTTGTTWAAATDDVIG